MNNLVKVRYANVDRMLLDNHIILMNNCGVYPTAKHLKKNNYSLEYALACLSQSKYKI